MRPLTGARRLAVGALALAPALALTLAPALAPAPAVASSSTAPAFAASSAEAAPGCTEPLLSDARPATEVARSRPAALRAAAGRNAMTGSELTNLAIDEPSLWLDVCGAAFYVDSAQRGTAEPTAQRAVPAGTNVLALSSRPGSQRTIYLDFTGRSLSGTAWNEEYGALDVEPYSFEGPVSTGFSTTEREQIYQAWNVVAEDYAPFDINVTTTPPSTAALDRTSPEDLDFGMRVLITNGGPIYDSCGCAGIAYTDVFDASGSSHDYYQPAWVFSRGVGVGSGWNIGEAVSHEAGHTLGLGHDGTSSSGYYDGQASWAPIMGVSYNKGVSQWSRGEYRGASNTQDDKAIIASNGAPLLADDRGDNSSSASVLTTNGLVGNIEASADVDAFRFSAAGQTKLSVRSVFETSDLDVRLRILNASGATVADVNPALDASQTYPTPSGLGASVDLALPSQVATYTALVEGVGFGDPLVAGRYSDYGSLGRYRVALSTNNGGVAPPPGMTTTRVPRAVAGRVYRATVRLGAADAGTTWRAKGLPRGLALRRVASGSSAVISGRVARTVKPGRHRVTVRVASPDGPRLSRVLVIAVVRR